MDLRMDPSWKKSTRMRVCVEGGVMLCANIVNNKIIGHTKVDDCTGHNQEVLS